MIDRSTQNIRKISHILSLWQNQFFLLIMII